MRRSASAAWWTYPLTDIGLLIDENLAARLVRDLADIFPGSAHVSDFGLLGRSDPEIWQAARAHGLAIVTKDEDFQRVSILQGAPPKVIWIGLGNCSTAEIAGLLRRRRKEIEEFLSDGEAAFLVLR